MRYGVLGRLVPIDRVDRFDVELHEPERTLYFENDREDEPYEQLVLLTRGGRTIPISTSHQESLGNVALRLNNALRRYRDDLAQPNR